MSLTDRARRSLYAEATGEVWLVLIALEAEGADPFRFGSDEIAIERGGAVFAPREFEIALPRESGAEFAGASLLIDDGDGALSHWLRALEGEAKPRVAIHIAIAAEPEIDQRQPMRFDVASMQITEGAARLDLVFRSAIATEPFPPIAYSANRFPALHD